MRMLEKYKIFPNSEELQKFDITPSSKWFLSENEQEEYDINEDFHHLTPPYPLMWMEFEHPGEIYSRSMGRRHVDPHSMGMLLQTFELKKDATEEFIFRTKKGENVLAGITSSLINRSLPASNGDDSETKKLLQLACDGKERIRWISLWTLFTDDRVFCSLSGKPFVPMMLRSGFFNETGRSLPGFLGAALLPEMASSEAMQLGLSAFLPFAFALQLLHCKNVVVSDVTLPPKVQKRRDKNGVPTVNYKILTITQLRKEVNSDTSLRGSSVKKALHFVRGHFKNFSDGGGLFGKYHGMYWWQPRMRGDRKSGEVKKDYVVFKDKAD